MWFTEWLEVDEDLEKSVLVQPDLVFPKYASVDVIDEEDLHVDLSMKVFFHRERLQYAIDTLTVLRRFPEDEEYAASEVTTSTLREITLQRYLQRTLLSHDVIPELEFEKDHHTHRLPETVRLDIRKAGPRATESHRWVARLYVWANAFHLPPTETVERLLGLSRPSASEWIRHARDAGVLRGPGPVTANVNIDEDRIIRRVLRSNDASS